MIADTQVSAGSLTAFDWFLVALLLMSTLLAFRRGIVKVLFSLGGVLAGILLASWNYMAFAAWLHGWITSFATAEVIAFLLILSAVTVVFSFLAGLVRKTVSAVGLGIFDRLFGAAFGFLRGVLVGVAILMAIAAFQPHAAFVEHSELAPEFLALARSISFLVPEHFRNEIARGATYLLQQTPELLRPHTLTQPM